MKKTMISTAVLALLFASCSSDDGLLDNLNYPADNVVRVTAQVDAPSTRAMTTDNLKEFYLSITNSANSTYSYQDVKFEKTADTWQPENQLLWQNATQAVTVKAQTWKPQNDSDSPAVETDQSTQGNFDKSDYLWFYDDNFVPQDKLKNQKIDINFKHGLSLLDIQITYGTEFNAATPLEATVISNMKVKGSKIVFTPTFQNASTTTLSSSITIAESGDATDIAPYHSGFTAATTQTEHAVDKFSCILVPQTFSTGAFSVEFVANGKFYQWNSSDGITLESGKKYQLNLTLGKDLVMAGDIYSTAWDNQDSKNLETE